MEASASALAFAEGQKSPPILGKVLDHAAARQESWTIEYVARVDPQQALKWSAELGGRYDDLVGRVVAQRGPRLTREVVALLAKQADWRAHFALEVPGRAYASSDPEKALRFAEEMIQRARRLDQPDRASSLAAAGTLVARLGKTEAARKLVEEAAGMAAKMGTDGRQAYVRGLVATAVAPFDVSRAMRLVEAVSEHNERERALARIATAIAPGISTRHWRSSAGWTSDRRYPTWPALRSRMNWFQRGVRMRCAAWLRGWIRRGPRR